MKRTLSIVLVLSLMLSAFVLASCKGTDKDAQNTAPPHSAASETAAPTDTPAAAPETEAPTADPNPRPDPVTVEWLAGEMQRRYYVGCMNLELMDFSDIMDRNEDTDLFFWDNQLEILLYKTIHTYRLLDVFPYEVHINQIVDESDTEITALMSVSLITPTFSGHSVYFTSSASFQITVDKTRMVIIDYSEPSTCASRYTSWLKPLATGYIRQGLTWEEANQKAYDEIAATYAEDAQ
jgi:predicted small secreted protein